MRFKPYQRQFVRPLHTHYGLWEVREGIIVHLEDQSGWEGWGEIAPLSWFGSETQEEAVNFCAQLPNYLSKEQILSIPDTLPACQFGFESALRFSHGVTHTLPYSYLLPTGKEALKAWKRIYQQNSLDGHPITFKWKIGVESLKVELNLWEQLIRDLPSAVKLRLDANGGLSFQQAKAWLKELNSEKRIEFLEQPLPVSEFNAMLALAEEYDTSLALDESVSTLKQLQECYQKGWRGIFVIKASIMGYPSRLLNFLQQNHLDCVFSTVFESEIGRQAVLNLAGVVGTSHRALGFGVNHWFREEFMGK